MKLTPTEKLARRICWLGFGPAGRKGKNERDYWASLPPETHRSYINEASLLASNVREIMRAQSSRTMLFAAMDERL